MTTRNEWWLALGVLVAAGAGGWAAEERVALTERFSVGAVYHVRTRVEISGTLNPPAVKGKPMGPLEVKGASAIEYDERILAAESGQVSKTMRIFRKLDFRRTLAGQPQHLALRPAVRRLVLLRTGHKEVPFSPDGPLTWGEIDAVRTDVFVPALAGLLPDRAVKLGERWTAARSAVQELTDLERIEEGQLDCRLDREVRLGGRRLAHIAFSGNIRGIGEDGPVRHRLNGHCHFDIEAGFLADLVLNGTTILLDADGKEVGKIEGRFVMMREPGSKSGELTDSSLRGVKVEPDADNTQLLYDNTDLGVRFLHPRRWRIAQVSGPQVALATNDGSGLLITVDPTERVPSAAVFLRESRGWLIKKKGKILRDYSPARRRSNPPLDTFALEVELADQKFWMDYYVTSQANGGATLAARLQPADLGNLRREIEHIAKSVVITKRIRAGK